MQIEIVVSARQRKRNDAGRPLAGAGPLTGACGANDRFLCPWGKFSRDPPPMGVGDRIRAGSGQAGSVCPSLSSFSASYSDYCLCVRPGRVLYTELFIILQILSPFFPLQHSYYVQAPLCGGIRHGCRRALVLALYYIAGTTTTTYNRLFTDMIEPTHLRLHYTLLLRTATTPSSQFGASLV